MIKHAAAPNSRVQFRKRDLRAIRIIQQRHVTPGLAKIHALYDGTLVPYIVIADNHHRGT